MRKCTVCDYTTVERNIVICPNCATHLLIDSQFINFEIKKYPIPKFNEKDFVNRNVEAITNLLLKRMESEMRISNYKIEDEIYYGISEIYFEYCKSGFNSIYKKESNIQITTKLIQEACSIVEVLFEERKCFFSNISGSVKPVLPEVKEKMYFYHNYLVLIELRMDFRNFK